MEHYSILLIDDDTNSQKSIAKILENSKFSVTVYMASHNDDVCKKAEEKLPNLIISDWDSDISKTHETVRSLKNNVSTEDVPIIIATESMSALENISTSLDTGVIEYIRKPIDKLELIARVDTMLKLEESYKKISRFCMNCSSK